VIFHDETSWGIFTTGSSIVVDGEPLSPETCAVLRGLYRRAEHEVHLGITVSRLLLGRKARSELGRQKKVAAVWVLAHELAHALPGPCNQWAEPETRSDDALELGWERELGEGLANLLGLYWTAGLSEAMGLGYLRDQISLDQEQGYKMWTQIGEYAEAVSEELVHASPATRPEMYLQGPDALLVQLAAMPPISRVAELDRMVEQAS
jgi:hypothetical protein